MRGKRTRLAGLGALCVLTVGLLAFAAPAVANESPSSVDATFAFPSATSQVVGSTGFVNDTEAGYFWSAARGDSVTETFAGGPQTAHKAILKVDVVTNVLSSGNEVDWVWEINGVQVGVFKVKAGFTGAIRKVATGLNISRPFTVKIRVTNEVPGGGGSHTLAYAGSFPHFVKLLK